MQTKDGRSSERESTRGRVEKGEGKGDGALRWQNRQGEISQEKPKQEGTKIGSNWIFSIKFLLKPTIREAKYVEMKANLKGNWTSNFY